VRDLRPAHRPGHLGGRGDGARVARRRRARRPRVRASSIRPRSTCRAAGAAA
jgi:hypothetical protein